MAAWQIKINKDKIDKNNQKYRDYVMKKAAIYKIVVFLVVLFLGAVFSLMIPLRPVVSELEKRKLTEFPDFTLESFIDGSYFAQIDTWFADTFPMRDVLITCNDTLDNLYGFRSNVIHGEVVSGDKIPDFDIDEGELGAVADSTVSQAPTSDGVEEKTAGRENDKLPSETEAEIADANGSMAAQAGEKIGSIFVTKDSAYGYYTFSQNTSEAYVDMVNRLSLNLSGKALVYNMIVPTSMDIMLNKETRKTVNSSDQREAILYMCSKMDYSVNKVYVYAVLNSHRDEYIYFRTDHHWTALGAYYAYCEFANKAGLTINNIDSFEKVDMGEFKGSFFSQTGISSLGNNPDTLIAYKPKSTNRMRYNKNGTMVDYNIVTDVSSWSKSSKYSSFIAGDNSYTEINNPDIENGKSCLVIKESFGNALVPFLVDHYQNVYVVDYRYYNRTISSLVEEKGIDTVLLINNVSATSTPARVNEMKKICK